MAQRWNYAHLSQVAVKHLQSAAAELKRGGFDQKLLDLVNIRASQMNGCTFCIDMHVKEAKIHGERDLRVHHVVVWRESPLFSEREKAALAWTEAVTELGQAGVSDDVYDRTRVHFSEQELSDLTLAIGLINIWNRLAISSRVPPGSADELLGLEKAGLR